MLDREKIKQELKARGMTFGTWAKVRDVEYSALNRVLHGLAGKDISAQICAYLDQDGLLFEEGGMQAETMQAALWSFSDASKYIGVSEARLRNWERIRLNGFPRAIRLGKGTSLMLSREAVQKWVSEILRQGELSEKREVV